MSLYKKNSWNFPCVSISIISFWQVYVFHFSKLTATIIWYRLWLQVIIAVRKKGLTGRRLHIVIYTRNSTTYSVIFCYNLDCIWNFQTHSMKKSEQKNPRIFINKYPYFAYLQMFWNTCIKLYGLFYHYKLGISICMWFKYFLYSEDG